MPACNHEHSVKVAAGNFSIFFFRRETPNAVSHPLFGAKSLLVKCEDLSSSSSLDDPETTAWGRRGGGGWIFGPLKFCLGVVAVVEWNSESESRWWIAMNWRRRRRRKRRRRRLPDCPEAAAAASCPSYCRHNRASQHSSRTCRKEVVKISSTFLYSVPVSICTHTHMT